MTDAINEPYLTSGQIAQMLHVSKGTVLRAVQRGVLTPALRMPGGSLRFRPEAIHDYVGRLGEEAKPEEAVGVHQAAGTRRTARGPAAVTAAPGGVEDRALDDLAGDAALILDFLTLVADGSGAGAIYVARPIFLEWRVVHIYDRMGMGLVRDQAAPFSAEYAASVSAGTGSPCLLVEDISRDARALSLRATCPGAGSCMCAALYDTDQSLYGVLTVLHPHPRAIPSGDAALFRLACSVLSRILHLQEHDIALPPDRSRR